MNDLSAVESIFFAALGKRTPHERAVYLDQACGADAELRGCVERMLQAHPRVGSFLQAPASGPAVTADEPAVTEKPGTVIGPYKLMEQIGEGGMGLVFVAEQQQPVRRKVALKIIKPGMDTREVIARFEAERQALALMDHPHIARVFDAGTTDSGRPYFVMELVKGIPIIDYCDQQQLTPRERLELFLAVCQAVQHAHGKGIIHRDLKPSNILVAPHDGVPMVKVIDFGVAKAIGQQLTDKTIYTRFTQMIGTPLYMSPEQAEINALDVDIRSDVYSLGVLLYELLTGTTPFDRKRFATAAFDEIRRIIKEEEPPRPSTRLSTLGETLSKVSSQRKTEPARLSALVRGELDWIVMKCLEKERNRRYETANGLARDVQRYLHDEPVEACPPSAGYRLRKAARKYRKPLAVAAAFGVLLVAGLALVTWKWQDERAARAEADAAGQDALAKAREIQEAAEQMNAANAAMDLGDYHVTFARWADADAEYTKATELRKDHSSVWLRRCRFYANLGLWDLAAADSKKAFELREPDAAIDWFHHALLLLEGGDTEAYHRLRRRMLDRFGEPTDRYALGGLVNTWTLADGEPNACMHVARLYEERVPATGTGRPSIPAYFLGAAYYRSGRFEEAIGYLRQSLTDTTWATRAVVFPVLAMALQQDGQHDEARQELANARKALEQWTQKVFDARNEFVPLQSWRDWVRYQRFCREAHTLIEGFPPPDDPRLRVVRGRALTALGRHGQAAAEYAQAVRMAPDDPQIRLACFHFHVANRSWPESEAEHAALVRLRPDDPKVHLDAFRAYADMKQWDRATAAHAEAIRLRPDDLLIRLERFRYHAERGEQAEAEKACAAVVSSGENDAAFRIKLGDACAELQQWSQARAQYAKAINLGSKDGNIWFRHAVLQLYLGDQEGYRRTYASLLDRHGTDPDPRTAHMLTLVGYLAADPGVDPARVVRMGEIHAKADRPHGEARLGIALVRAGRYDEAVPLLTGALNRYGWDRLKIALALAQYRQGEVENARHLMGQVGPRYRQLNPAGAMWPDTLETQLLYRDAEAVIQSERWREMCNLVKAGQLTEADVAMKKLLPAEPGTAPEFVVRGLYHMELGQWDRAARDYGEAIRRGADDPRHWQTHAILCRLAGQEDEHRRICALMLKRFDNTEDPWVAFGLLLACQRVIEPAQRDLLLLLTDKNPDLGGLRGYLLYRQGEYEAAARHLEEVLKTPKWLHSQFQKLYLAMACQRLGRGEQARTLLAEASSWIASNPRIAPWFAPRQELKMLREEAEELILRKPAGSSP